MIGGLIGSMAFIEGAILLLQSHAFATGVEYAYYAFLPNQTVEFPSFRLKDHYGIRGDDMHRYIKLAIQPVSAFSDETGAFGPNVLFSYPEGLASTTCLRIVERISTRSEQRICLDLKPSELYTHRTSDEMVLCGAQYIRRGAGKTLQASTHPISTEYFKASIIYEIPNWLLLSRNPEQDLARITFDLCVYQWEIPNLSSPIMEGSLRLFQEPSLKASTTLLPVTVQVRTFIEPGWNSVIKLEGSNFTESVNLVAFHATSCEDFYDTDAYYASPASKIETRPSNDGNTSAVVQVATFKSGENFKQITPELGLWNRRYRLNGKLKGVSQRRPGTRSNSDLIASFYLCFYPSQQSSKGLHIGYISFYTDPEDTLRLIGFIIFSAMVMPFVVVVTLSCYSYRHQRLRQKLRKLRLLQQREEIEQRLLDCLKDDAGSSDSNVDEPFSMSKAAAPCYFQE